MLPPARHGLPRSSCLPVLKEEPRAFNRNPDIRGGRFSTRHEDSSGPGKGCRDMEPQGGRDDATCDSRPAHRCAARGRRGGGPERQVGAGGQGCPRALQRQGPFGLEAASRGRPERLEGGGGGPGEHAAELGPGHGGEVQGLPSPHRIPDSAPQQQRHLPARARSTAASRRPRTRAGPPASGRRWTRPSLVAA
jgi:hypothetical protein